MRVRRAGSIAAMLVITNKRGANFGEKGEFTTTTIAVNERMR